MPGGVVARIGPPGFTGQLQGIRSAVQERAQADGACAEARRIGRACLVGGVRRHTKPFYSVDISWQYAQIWPESSLAGPFRDGAGSQASVYAFPVERLPILGCCTAQEGTGGDTRDKRTQEHNEGLILAAL